MEPITGCVDHRITEIMHGYTTVYKVEVYRDSVMTYIYDDGECEFEGGIKVATLYRYSLNDAHNAGIFYSLLTRPIS